MHYENNAPFAAAEIEREIEISHWGNVYVEERYHVVRGMLCKMYFTRLTHRAAISSRLG